jgi:predicted MFS family arabinose efflux permease
MADTSATKTKATFTKYEALIITILAITQFTVILDFMVLSPLGAQLMKELSISTSQFGAVVSAYAFSAGIAGLLTAGFADRFDRKKLLLFFYSGFIIGTFLCGIAPDYKFLLMARIVTGLFGGVISSISFAIITDLFKMEVRGRVMGFVQMAFAVSQVMGIPVGLLLANNFGWHSPFMMIVVLAALTGILIFVKMKPVAEHLKIKSERNPFQHLLKTLSTPNYLRGFMATVLLATGGFMLMPFGSAFSISNLGLTQDQLPILYFITGIFSMIFGPLSGRLSDKIGKYNMFIAGSIITILMVSIYTHLSVTPLWEVIILNVILFVGISSRMISASALMTAVPAPQDRGAFMGINASIQQLSGGIAAFAAGKIVIQTKNAPLQHYDILGYVVVCSMLITIGMMYIINKQVMGKQTIPPVEKAKEVVAAEAE